MSKFNQDLEYNDKEIQTSAHFTLTWTLNLNWKSERLVSCVQCSASEDTSFIEEKEKEGVKLIKVSTYNKVYNN